MLRSFILFALLASLLPAYSLAANVDVCDTCQHTQLWMAIDAAQPGDTIRLAAGSFGGASPSRPVTIRGGYSADFSVHDPATYQSTIGGLNIAPSTNGTIVLEDLEIAGGPYALVNSGENTAVRISRCNIHHLTDYALYLTKAAAFTLEDSYLGYNGGYYGLWLNTAGAHTQVIIRRNTFEGHAGSSGMGGGLLFSQAKTGDIIEGNLLFNNRLGLRIEHKTASEAPVIQNNIAHHNTSTGIDLSFGSPVVSNNLVYTNGGEGLQYFSTQAGVAPQFINNTFAANSHAGLRISTWAAASPVINNNIFFANGWTGLLMDEGSGWGASDAIPTEFRYNVFSQNEGPEVSHSGLPPSYSFNIETPGWGNMNEPVWSEGNVVLDDPGFLDSAGHDYRLAANSFLIDEGDPDSLSAAEPAPNGSRINPGFDGGTGSAQTSPAAPQISNVSARQDGTVIAITFDTNSATSYAWLSAEYYNGSEWVAVNSAQLSGAVYTDGWKAGRIQTGLSRTITWAAQSALLGTQNADARIRLTLTHGEQSSTAASPSFATNFSAPAVELLGVYNGGTTNELQPWFGATARDGDGTVASIRFSVRPQGSETWTILGTDPDADPISAVWGSFQLSPGISYEFRVEATDDSDLTTATTAAFHICSYSFSPSPLNVTADSASYDLQVTPTNQSCGWSATSPANWIFVSSNNLSGEQTIQVNVTLNSSQNSRSATVDVHNSSLAVNQAGAAPAPTPTPEPTPTPGPADPTPSPTPIVEPTPIRPADLTAVQISSRNEGTNYVLRAVCANSGGSVSASFQAKLYLSRVRRVSGSSSKLISKRTIAPLQPGAQTTPLILRYPKKRLGQYKYSVLVCSPASGEEQIANNTLYVRTK